MDTYSFTQLSHYLGCPLRYKYRYLEGWREKPTRASLHFGRAFESALAALFLGQDPIAQFHQEWQPVRELPLEYTNGDSWERMLRQAERLLERFVQDNRVRIRNPKRNLQLKLVRHLPEAGKDFIANQVTGFSFPNGTSASFGYSPQRLQLTSLSYTKGAQTLLSLSYGYTQGGGNNGQITQISDSIQSGRTVNYTYDTLHRLKTAVTTGSASYPQWGLSWTYDRYGNRTAQTVTHGSAPSNSVTVSTTTNRITSMAGFTFYYDANGNLTQDDLYKYKYDAENRLVEVRQLSDALVATYAFDGKGLRVVKVVGPDRTFYLYSGTQLISEYEDAASNNYSPGTTPGQAPSDSVSTLLYQHPDHLTTRLTTDNDGELSNEQAHYPYGERWYSTGTADPSVLRKFTSYLKEDETASARLNYAVFREHSARIGRFHMADPVQGRGTNPQSLNRYAYVVSEPVLSEKDRKARTLAEWLVSPYSDSLGY